MAAFSRADTPPATLEAAAGDARADGLPGDFDQLYGEHFEFVWRTLRRLGVNPVDLDDAVQDVFIVLLRRRAEFRGQSSHRTWLFGIANNVSHEYHRKRQRAERLPLVTPGDAPSPATPLEQASSAEALRVIEQFLSTLDEDKRNVFILAELEQMSAPEIASALQVKLNTVYSRLRAARQAFSEFLAQHEAVEP